MPLLPEISILGAALLVLIFNLLFPKKTRLLFPLALILSVFSFLATFGTAGGSFFSDTFLSDNLSLFFRRLFILGAILIILISRDFFENFKYQAEYLILTLFAALGMMITVSAHELITLFLGIELTTITFYLLAAFHKHEQISSEAGLKFFIQGTVSTAILLYGFSFLFGLSGSTYFSEIKAVLVSATPLTTLAVVLILSGFAFKIALVPFHLWIPDVYEGAPTPVTAYLSVGSKVAGFVALIRFLGEPLFYLQTTWIPLLLVLSAITMTLGNLFALPQTNLKRLLAFSSIAQAGFILIGLTTTTLAGIKGTLFYLVAYFFSNLLAFACVIFIYQKIKSYDLKNYFGLAQKLPKLCLIFTLSLLSLTGIPPIIGFFGKFLVLSAAIEVKLIWLAMVAILNVALAAYYYFRIIRAMYLVKPEKAVALSPLPFSFETKLALFLLTGLILILSLFPNFLLDPISNLI